MGWLKRIMINTAIDELRKNKMLPEIGGILDYVWEITDNNQDADQLLLYKDLIIFRDLVERYNIREIAPLRYLMNYLYKNRSTLVSINRLYNDLKSQGVAISKSTMYDFIGFSL